MADADSVAGIAIPVVAISEAHEESNDDGGNGEIPADDQEEAAAAAAAAGGENEEESGFEDNLCDDEDEVSSCEEEEEEEPKDVKLAWEELVIIQREQQRYSDIKLDLVQDLEEFKARQKYLEDVSPFQINFIQSSRKESNWQSCESEM